MTRATKWWGVVVATLVVTTVGSVAASRDRSSTTVTLPSGDAATLSVASSAPSGRWCATLRFQRRDKSVGGVGDHKLCGRGDPEGIRGTWSASCPQGDLVLIGATAASSDEGPTSIVLPSGRTATLDVSSNTTSRRWCVTMRVRGSARPIAGRQELCGTGAPTGIDGAYTVDCQHAEIILFGAAEHGVRLLPTHDASDLRQVTIDHDGRQFLLLWRSN